MYNYTFFYGTALTRLALDKRTFGIKVFSGNNTFLVNDNSLIYLKHSSKRLSPWSFTFLPDHIKEIGKLGELTSNLFIVLICNDNGICCLTFDEFSRLIYIGELDSGKWVSVRRSPREKYSISGSNGALKYKVADNDFPEKLLKEKGIKGVQK